MTCDLLIHVEDPGAANWVATLVPALAAERIAATVVADGAAQSYLAERGVAWLDDAAPAPALLRRHRPRAVLVGTSENPDTRALAVIDAAATLGVPSLAIVDQPANAEHRFRGRDHDPLRHAPRRVIVPDRRTGEAMRSLGLAVDRIAVVGNPHHDQVRARSEKLAAEGREAVRARLFPAIATGRALVVFVCEVGYVVNPEAERWERENRFVGRGGSRYRTAVILEEVIDALASIDPRPALVLRLHPKNGAAEFEAYAREIAAVSRGGDPIEVVFCADLVVGMTSALLEEAHLIGRPTLAVLPRAEERQWLACLADGEVPTVGDRAELRARLPDLLRRSPIASRATPAPAPALPRLVGEILSTMRARCHPA